MLPLLGPWQEGGTGGGRLKKKEGREMEGRKAKGN
jgi:hypothetical protein